MLYLPKDALSADMQKLEIFFQQKQKKFPAEMPLKDPFV